MLAARLSRYCQSLCYDDLPSSVVHEVKRRVLDSLGCALGAWNAPLHFVHHNTRQVVVAK